MSTPGTRIAFADGFDHYATADRFQMYSTEVLGHAGILIAAVGRRGTNGLKLLTTDSGNNTSRLVRNLAGLVTGKGFICGYGFKGSPFAAISSGTTENSASANALVNPRLSGTSQVWFRLSTTGQIILMRGTTTLATSSLTLTQATFQFIECEIWIDNAAGWVNVWVDGINFIAITGINTQGGAAAAWDDVILPAACNNSTAVEYDVDDLYVMDMNGYATTLNGAINSSVTTFTLTDATQLPSTGGGAFRIQIDNEIIRVTALSGNNVTACTRGFGLTTAAAHSNGAAVSAKCRQGDLRWDAVYPTGDGAHTDATLSTGTQHFAVVDETTPNGDTDYSTLAAVGNRESLTFPTAPVAGADIVALMLLHSVRKTDAGASGMKQTLRLSSTDYDGPENGIPSNYIYCRRMISERPSDSAPILDTDFNACQIGQLKSS